MSNPKAKRKHDTGRARDRFVAGFWDGLGAAWMIWRPQGSFPRRFARVEAGDDWELVGDDIRSALSQWKSN